MTAPELARDETTATPGLQNMRTIFKKYLRLRPQEIDSDARILDSRNLGSSAHTELVGIIPSSTLKSTFGAFNPTAPTEDHLEDIKVYSHKQLAGLHIAPSLLSANVQSALLSCLIHRDLSNPSHQTNLHMFHGLPYPTNGPETGSSELRNSVIASFFSYPPSSSTVFEPKDPSIHRPIGIKKVMEKSLRWITLGGQYDWTNKVYPEGEPPPFPPDIARLLEGLFPDTKAQAAIVNFYSPGDTLSLHQDVSEECDRPLLSISLGCDAIFMIGLAKDTLASDTLVIRLRSGDAVYMSREARFAFHAVPKVLANTCPEYLRDWPASTESQQFEKWRGWMNNKRINLNVRQMRD